MLFEEKMANTSRESLENLNDKFGKKITSSKDGFTYQDAVFLFFSHRALLNNVEFCITQEKDNAKKFDDIVFKYKKENENRMILAQIKLNQKSDFEIKFNNLMGGIKDNFSLVKYFKSYIEVKNDADFGDKIEYVILYTNSKLDERSIIRKPTKFTQLKSIQNIIEDFQVDNENILNIFKASNTAKFYRFKHLVFSVFEDEVSDNGMKSSRSEIEDFFNKFVFAVEQPIEQKLDDTVENELKIAYFPCDATMMRFRMKSEIDKWIRDKSKDVFISHVDLRKVFEKEENQSKLFISSSPIVEYDKKISHLSIEFDDDDFVEKIHSFIDGDLNCMVIQSLKTKLTSIKFYNILKKRTENYLYFRITQLNGILDYVFDYFKIRDCVLIIEDDLTENNHSDKIMQKLYKHIENVLENMSKRKLILITTTNKFFQELIQKFSKEFVKITDEKNRFIDLKDETKRKIVHKENTVIFQGYLTNLNESIHDFKEIIDNEYLYKIIFDEKITIGENIGTLSEVNHYINRTLSCKVFIDESEYWIDLNERDFYNMNANLETSITKYAENMDIIEKIGDVRRKQEMNERYKRDQSEEDILDEPIKNEDSKYEKSLIIDEMCSYIKNQIMFIGGDAGVGKSTLFNSLEKNVKLNHSDCWIGKLNLPDFTTYLNEIKNQNLEKVVNDFLFFALKIDKAIEKDCFLHLARRQKIILFFDSFDEIYSEHKETVIDLIQVIDKKNMTKQIWISTRSYSFILADIKNRNITKSFCEIKPFSKEDQEVCLENYWMKNRIIDSSYVKRFVKIILDTFDEHLQNDFTGNALHIMMIAINLESMFDEYIESSENDFLNDNKKEIVQSLKLDKMYEKFIEKKIFQNNCKLCKKYKYLHIYEKYVHSLDFLFEENFLSTSLMNEIRDIKNILNFFKISNETDEIIKGIDSNGKPVFIHKTYAEYFATRWFIESLRDNLPNYVEKISFFFTKVVKLEYTTICKFFDSVMDDELVGKMVKLFNSEVIENIKRQNDKIINFVIKVNCLKIAKFLIENGIEITNESKDEEFALHLAAKSSDYYSLLQLLETLKEKCGNYQELISKPNYNSDTPLNIAIISNNLNGFKAIWESCDDITKWKLVNTINNQRNTIFHLAILGKTDVLKIVIEFIENELFSENSHCDDNSNEQDLKIHKGYKPIRNIFHENPLKTIFQQNGNGDTFLHILAKHTCNENVTFVMKFLKNFRIDLRNILFTKNNSYEIPLQIACKYNHERTIIEILDAMMIFEKIDDILNIVDQWDNAILHLLACNENSGNGIKLILEHVSTNEIELKKQLYKKSFYDRTPFLCACKSGYENNAKELLKAMVRFEKIEDILNVKDTTNCNALHLAASNEKTENIVKMIIDLVSDNESELKKLLFSIGFIDQTPLHCATTSGHKNCVIDLFNSMKKFEDVGYILNMRDKRKSTVLSLAASNKRTGDSVKFILDSISDNEAELKKQLFSKCFESRTPLHYACRSGHKDSIKLLFDAMKKFENTETIMNLKDDYNSTVLYMASCNKNIGDGLKLILDFFSNDENELKKQLFSKGFQGQTPIACAFRCAHEDSAKLLMDAMKKFESVEYILNMKNSNNSTVLHLAASNNHTENGVKLILDLISNDEEQLKNQLHARGYQSNTPLHCAFTSGHENSAKLLLNAMKNVYNIDSILSMKNEYLSTLLHVAANRSSYDGRMKLIFDLFSGNEPELRKHLLAHGFLDRIPLHYACRGGTDEIVKELIDEMLKFDSIEFILDLKDRNGSKVLQLLASNEKIKIGIEYVLGLMSNNETELRKHLFTRGFFNRTPLLVASRGGNGKNMKILLNAMLKFESIEFILDMKDCKECNLLTLAAMNQKTEKCVKIVLNSISNDSVLRKWLFFKSGWDETALHRALRNGHENSAKEVLRHMRKFENIEFILDMRDKNGDSPLHIAACYKNTNGVKLILDSIANDESLLKKYLSIKGNFDQTPLFRACKSNNLNNVKELLGYMEKIEDFASILNIKDNTESIVLHMAAGDENCLNPMKMILKTISNDECELRKQLFERGHLNRIPLHYACRNSSDESIKELLNLMLKLESIEVILNVKDVHDSAAIHLIASNRKSETSLSFILDLLSNNESELKNQLFAKGFHDRTPLHCACSSGNENNIKTLLIAMKKFESIEHIKAMTDIDNYNILDLAATAENSIIELDSILLSI